MKYAVEVAKLGSLNKASDSLRIAQPNISRSIKELEADLNITIFNRSAKGMVLTPEGEEFVNYAQGILTSIDQVEMLYKQGTVKKQKFSISVPRACYISEAFAEFSKKINDSPAEIFYQETHSQQTINNVLNNDYKLGIIRYSEKYDKYYKEMLEEKGLYYELVCEFTYNLIMSRNSPLAQLNTITYDDLVPYIEIAHADPTVPSLPLSKATKEELPDNINRHIFVFERASQFDILSQNTDSFMWVSPASKRILDKYDLIQKKCVDNNKIYKDILIYRSNYKLSELDKLFITDLCETRRKYMK